MFGKGMKSMHSRQRKDEKGCLWTKRLVLGVYAQKEVS